MTFRNSISRMVETWERDGTRYRRVIMCNGDTVIQRAEDGQYVEHYRRGRP